MSMHGGFTLYRDCVLPVKTLYRICLPHMSPKRPAAGEVSGTKSGVALGRAIVYTRCHLEPGGLYARKEPPMHRRLFMALTASLLMSGLSGVGATASAVEAFRALAPEQRRQAPALTLPDHRGTPVDLAELRGKVVVVRFWATW